MEARTKPRAPTKRPAPGRRLGLHQPPGKVFNGLVAAGAAAFLGAASYPVFHLGLAALALLIWMALGAAWFVRGVFMGWYSMAGRLGPTDRRRRFRYAPMIVIVAVVIAVSLLPLRMRFMLSQPFLSDAATDLSVGAEVDDEPLGLYMVRSAELFGESTVFTTAAGGFFLSGGFAHLPDGPRSADVVDWADHVSLRHMHGNWYSWVD